MVRFTPRKAYDRHTEYRLKRRSQGDPDGAKQCPHQHLHTKRVGGLDMDRAPLNKRSERVSFDDLDKKIDRDHPGDHRTPLRGGSDSNRNGADKGAQIRDKIQDAGHQTENQGTRRTQSNQRQRNRQADRDDRDNLADKPPLERIGHLIDNFEYKVAALVRQQALQPISIGARIETHKEADEKHEEDIARGAKR